jgi:hypothetical protein
MASKNDATTSRVRVIESSPEKFQSLKRKQGMIPWCYPIRKNHQLNLNGDDNALSSASGGGGASDLLTIHRHCVAVSVEE